MSRLPDGVDGAVDRDFLVVVRLFVGGSDMVWLGGKAEFLGLTEILPLLVDGAQFVVAREVFDLP